MVFLKTLSAQGLLADAASGFLAKSVTVGAGVLTPIFNRGQPSRS
jgi:hypothetical protein